RFLERFDCLRVVDLANLGKRLVALPRHAACGVLAELSHSRLQLLLGRLGRLLLFFERRNLLLRKQSPLIGTQAEPFASLLVVRLGEQDVGPMIALLIGEVLPFAPIGQSGMVGRAAVALLAKLAVLSEARVAFDDRGDLFRSLPTPLE